MRSQNTNDGLTVRAIAGTHNVILAIDLNDDKRAGCLGFSIQRAQLNNLNPGQSPEHWMINTLKFKDSPPDPPATPSGAPSAAPIATVYTTTQTMPWQSFRYNDFGAQPATHYQYTIIAQYGAWNQLQEGRRAQVDVTTESPVNADTALYFNRAAASSEAYNRTFNSQSPEAIQDPVLRQRAYDWLSNGLEKAILDFVGQASDNTYSLHAAIYEFQKDTLLQGLKKALTQDANVQVVYHHRQPPLPGQKNAPTNVAADPANGTADDSTDKGTALANDAQIRINGLDGKNKDGSPICIPRAASPQGAIMHNKFVVLLKDSKPVAVWTGSTNWTDGGLYGQLNLGIAIYDPRVAKTYNDYWLGLSKDPSAALSKSATAQLTPVAFADSSKIAPGYTPLFSPQPPVTQMLNLYGNVCLGSKFLLVCAPFELADQILAPLKQAHPGKGAYLLLDKEGSLGKDPKARPDSQSGGDLPTPKTTQSFSDIQNNPGTLISVATPLEGALLDFQHKTLETVESFHHVGIHIHAKIIASDPLGPDPILILGSANYSNGSTFTNDENSLIIRGKLGLMDICVTEFMRMFDTYRFRYEHKADVKGFVDTLSEDDHWTDEYYVPGSAKAIGRQYFAGTI